MSDKSTLLRAFNTQFFDFLKDIITIFPDNQDIKLANTSFETIKKANPTLILKAWYSYVYHPYRDVIDAGDIEFFFDKDYGSDLSIVPNASEIMKMIDKIRQPIKELSDENKEHTKKYIQILSKLSMHYSEM
jgi:hypothetical protein